MSAFKKVISLVLCFAMLLGTVAVAGDLLAPKATAAEGTSSVKTYAELAEQYDNFIYLATDAYETVDGELVLSDGYVQPGDLLTFRLYFKSDRYIGSSTLYQVCDFDFFDNTRVTGAEPNSTGGYTEGLNAVSNSEHPMVSGHEMTFSMTSNQGSNVAWLKTVCLIDTTVLATWGTIQIVTNTAPKSPLGTQALRLNQDIWMLEFYLTVREGLEEGTTGTIRTEFDVWMMSAHPTTGVAPDKRKRANVYSLPAPATEDAWDSKVDENSCGSMAAQYSSIQAFLYDDLTHTFTIGENPNDTPVNPPVEVKSSVKTYAELAEQYDNFIYLATDAYETVDGNLVLSDGYVQPGDLLTFRLYFKSDRYIGSSTLYQVCDFDFFDNTRVTGAEPNSTGGYTEGLNAVSNSAHPMVSGHEMTFSMTSNQGSNVAWLKTVCLIDTTVLATWGTIQIVTNTAPKSPLGTQALRLNQDIWMLEFYLTVKEGLAEGTTGTIRTEFNVWMMSAHPTTGVAPDKRKRANVYSLPAPASEDAWDSKVDENSCGSMAAQYSSIQAFLYDDLTHTFTIGDAPSGPVATTYTAEFIENDGSTVISSEKYEKGAAVTVPEAVAEQLGWADASTGKLVDLTDYTMPGKKVTFVRVLSTDKFDLKIDLDGGSVDASALPADVTDNGDGTLTAKVPFNGSFDLSTIPAPEKTGYTASWDPSTVTVDSIKGASSKVVWTANTYKVSFYANKGDAEPFTVVDATYGKSLTLTIPADSFDKKLGAWVDYETDEEACAAALKGTNYVAQFGTFTGTSDKSYYASFTEFNSSISFMVRDYESMDINAWKTYTIKYNDAGQKLSVNNITAIVNALKAEGLTVRTLAGQATRYAMYTDSTLSTAIDTTSGIAFDGAKEIYVATVFTVNVTWQVPVFDEATASYTEDLNEATVSQTSLSSGTTPAEIKSVFEVNIKVPSTLKYDAAAGYKFDGWFDEQGNPYTYDSYWGVSLPCGSPENVVLTARFSETQYDVILNMNNGDSPDTLTIEGVKVGLGDSIDLDGATLINTATSEAVEHPVIGAENSEQPVAYRGMNGYKFLGWSVHKAATADDIIEFPIDSISYEGLKTSLYKGNIVLYAVWEALEYDLVLMYDTPESNPKGPFDERVFAEPLTFKVKTGDTIETYTKDESIKNLAIENAPEGFKFYDWCQKNGATITDSKMPAYGAKYYANYTSRVIKVYVDYNHGRVDEEGNAIESIQLSALSQSANKDNWLYYGEDFERKADDEAGIKQGAGPEIRNTLVTGNLRPGENYEVVGWDVYHVKNEEDVFDKTKWIKGVNDDGSTIAKDTIVYQIQWKHHSEFLFRVYDTDAKICKALGKNLKMYYWKNGNYATRKEAQVNAQPELLVIFFLKPTLENWDATRFFDIEMWRSLSLRFDPFSVPKSALTIEAFVAFMKMIPELIGNLING